MNKKFNELVKNFGHILLSNLVTLSISIIITLIIPKVIGVEQYGYLQLYLFYASYLGFLQFGWNDGLYLKIGGNKYSELKKNKIFSQFWSLVISQITIGTILISFSKILNMDVNKSFIFYILGFTLIAIGSRAMLLFIFQATNRFKEFSRIMIIDRLTYLFLIIFLLIIGIDNFKYIITADLISKSLTLFYSMYLARDLVFMSPASYKFAGKDIYDNIRIGINLMFANVAGMLILGIVRYGIEFVWDVETFGKISMILSISMMLMVFINAVSTVLFPMLRRIPKESLPTIYVMLRDLLMPFLIGTLFLYFPLKIFLIKWLPDYTDSINYMFIIFPIIIFEGKMSVLVNTYLKTMRYEKLMLKVNIIGVAISTVLTTFFSIYLENLTLTVLSILIVLAIRSLIAEIFLSNILDVRVLKDILVEIALTSLFVLIVWFVPMGVALIIYSCLYTLYIFVKKKDIKLMRQTINRFISEGSEKYEQ